MSKINILPEHLINQIAAGEVVERPASVVKELVENSLDAGAKRIIVEVNGGGDSLIRVTDDGCGMDKDDAKLAFERHATSKIASQEDLFKIMTMGFRGEAIASIASVSYLTLQTKKQGELAGTLIISEGGKLKKVKNLGCPEGTQIEVKQLFYNTPVRKKYLKNDATEYSHIVNIVTGIALAYPVIAFKLVHDNKVVFDLPATEDVLTRVRGLLGKDTADGLIPVFNGHSNMQLEGFIGKPDIARSNRNGQRLYVNGREVSSHVLSYAVKQSYFSLLPKEKYPVFLLFLTIDPSLIDVNVHPRKSEVRFLHEKEIFSIFTNASKKALEKHVLAPSFDVVDESKEVVETEPTYDRQHQPIMKVEDKPVEVPAMVSNSAATQEDVETFQVKIPKVSSLEVSSSEVSQLQKSSDPDLGEQAALREDTDELVPLAQLDNSYILCQQGKSLIIMDQHAAHERVRYTEFLEDFDNKKKASQPLLAPLQIELSLQESSFLQENNEFFQDMGFEIEHFGGNTFSVYSVPTYLVNEDIKATILGLIDDLNDQAIKGDFQVRKERALTYTACRSAVKFGDPLSIDEQKRLCKRLMELELPYTCPHGRPTMFTITFDELEKRFGRKY